MTGNTMADNGNGSQFRSFPSAIIRIPEPIKLPIINLFHHGNHKGRAYNPRPNPKVYWSFWDVVNFQWVDVIEFQKNFNP